MSKEKRNYIIVSEYGHFCIIKDGFEVEAIEIVKTMKLLYEDNNPRIFRIAEEIYLQNEGNKDLTEKRIFSNGREFGGAADF